MEKDTWPLYLLHIELTLVFVIELEVAIFREDWLFILLQAQLPALIDDCMKQVVLLVATAKQLIALAVVDVEEIVGVLTGVLDQLWGEWSESNKGCGL